MQPLPPEYIALYEMRVAEGNSTTRRNGVVMLLLDVETPCLSPSDEYWLYQLAVTDGEGEDFNAFVKQQHSMAEWAPKAAELARQNNVTDEMLSTAKECAVVTKEFREWLDTKFAGCSLLFVTYNSSFDRRWLLHFLGLNDETAPTNWRFACALALARLLKPKPHVANHQLGTV